MKKLVVFDLDGTLNRTELYAVPAHKKALAELNVFDKTDEFIISLFGERGEDCVHLLLNSHDKELGKEYFKRVSQYEAEFIETLFGAYEGSLEMLVKLHQDGYNTAICSNSSERYIKMVLTKLSLIKQIDFIQPLVPGMIKDETLKLLIERECPEKTVMVGDRRFDKAAATANNIPFIGCLYGFNPSEVADADRAVNTASEINVAVEELIGKCCE